jgi:hypothetical protein
MDIDETTKKLIFQVSMELPGYEQLLPRSQINLKYEIKKILKQYTKTLLDSHKKKSNVAKLSTKERRL